MISVEQAEMGVLLAETALSSVVSAADQDRRVFHLKHIRSSYQIAILALEDELGCARALRLRIQTVGR